MEFLGKMSLLLFFARRSALNWWWVQALISFQEGFPLSNGNGFLDSALDGVVRTITVAKPPGAFPLSSTRIKEHQSHDITAVFEHCQVTTSTHTM